MHIEPYSPADADGIRSMLADHVDYAPEQVTKDASEDDLAFFEDAFVHENDGLIAYTLKDEGIVIGFMTLSRQFLSPEDGAWYITALFVRHNRYRNTKRRWSIYMLWTSYCRPNIWQDVLYRDDPDVE